MRLAPRRPPGRLNRKALAFSPEIRRLHGEGHTCEAIRLALLDAGLSISRATVHREIVRTAPQRQTDRAPVATASVERPMWCAPETHATSRLASDPRSSKEIAEAFVRGRITNPLLRARSTA
jgi:hypothetical protein